MNNNDRLRASLCDYADQFRNEFMERLVARITEAREEFQVPDTINDLTEIEVLRAYYMNMTGEKQMNVSVCDAVRTIHLVEFEKFNRAVLEEMLDSLGR